MIESLLPLVILGALCGALLVALVNVLRLFAAERRLLVNALLSDTPTEFAVRQSASQPDDVVTAIAESRQSPIKRTSPLGL